MKDARFIVDTETGPALIQQIEGTTVTVFGSLGATQIDAGDMEWKQLHAKLKTGKLDFATVKKEHGITEVQDNK